MRILLNTVIAVLLSCSALFAADAVPTDTAALVNGAVITTAEFRGELARTLRLSKKTEQDLDPATLALMKKEALETLIARELLYQESKRDGVRIQDEEIDAELASLKKKFPSEADFKASLGKLNQTNETVTSQIRHGMAIQKLLDSRFSAKTAVKGDEARGYYEVHQNDYKQPVQIRLSHILVKSGTLVSDKGKTPALTKVEDIYRRISEGEDFALLAKESDDGKSSSIGGDLGYFTPGQLGKTMEAAAFSLAAGQISTIVEDRFGYHILKVTERRPEGVLPFEGVREKIIKQLQRERMLAEVSRYLKRLREVAKVEIHLSGE